MALEKLVFDVDEGVTVELKPELLVREDLGLAGTYVSATLTHRGQSQSCLLNYNLSRVYFYLEDFQYEHNADMIDNSQAGEMAQTFSNLLCKGFIKVREGNFNYAGNDEWHDSKQYQNLRSYQESRDLAKITR